MKPKKSHSKQLFDQKTQHGYDTAPDSIGEKSLLQILENSKQPLWLDEIISKSGASAKMRKKILLTLASLQQKGAIIYLSSPISMGSDKGCRGGKGGKYIAVKAIQSITGRLEVRRGGMGFVISKDTALKGQDLYVSPSFLASAWNGDVVKAGILPGKRGKSPEGIILDVLERKSTDILARVIRLTGKEGDTREALCSPLDRRHAFTLLVDVGELDKNKDTPAVLEGDILHVRPSEHLEHGLWRGSALLNIGSGTDVDAQEQIVKLAHDIATFFPENVLSGAQSFGLEPAQADFSAREDLRHKGFVTIDGAQAKDFDDAIYVEETGAGYTLWVSIADVTHYVRPGSPLDKEALARGNSYYFAKSVEPMLPEELSNGLCSLVPQQNRLAVTAEMYFNKNGDQAASPKLYLSVIKSSARLVYEQVSRAVVDKNPIDTALLGPALDMLTKAKDLALLLQKQRRQRGALFLDLPEVEARLDANGQLKNLEKVKITFAHKMIEEFMLAANEAVADFLAAKGEVFPYRTHPAPDTEKITALFKMLARLNFWDGKPKKDVSSFLPELLEQIKGHEFEYLVGSMVLRSLMQARYSADAGGHFGLASACYTHFTSPIRRYADVLVHRALRRALKEDGGGTASKTFLENSCETINTCEKKSKDAEHELDKRLGALYLKGKIGEQFEGVISGITDYGFFVELDENAVEGLVRLQSLNDEFIFFPERFELRGHFGGSLYRLGQKITVRVVEVHIHSLEIIFEQVAPATKEANSPKGEPKRSRPKGHSKFYSKKS